MPLRLPRRVFDAVAELEDAAVAEPSLALSVMPSFALNYSRAAWQASVASSAAASASSSPLDDASNPGGANGERGGSLAGSNPFALSAQAISSRPAHNRPLSQRL